MIEHLVLQTEHTETDLEFELGRQIRTLAENLQEQAPAEASLTQDMLIKETSYIINLDSSDKDTIKVRAEIDKSAEEMKLITINLTNSEGIVDFEIRRYVDPEGKMYQKVVSLEEVSWCEASPKVVQLRIMIDCLELLRESADDKDITFPVNR
jgi:hypothetical protein